MKSSREKAETIAKYLNETKQFPKGQESKWGVIPTEQQDHYKVVFIETGGVMRLIAKTKEENDRRMEVTKISNAFFKAAIDNANLIVEPYKGVKSFATTPSGFNQLSDLAEQWEKDRNNTPLFFETQKAQTQQAQANTSPITPSSTATMVMQGSAMIKSKENAEKIVEYLKNTGQFPAGQKDRWFAVEQKQGEFTVCFKPEGMGHFTKNTPEAKAATTKIKTEVDAFFKSELNNANFKPGPNYNVPQFIATDAGLEKLFELANKGSKNTFFKTPETQSSTAAMSSVMPISTTHTAPEVKQTAPAPTEQKVEAAPTPQPLSPEKHQDQTAEQEVRMGPKR